MATRRAPETTDSPDAPLDQQVRGRLRRLRVERGLTLQQVAEMAHLDVSTLSRLESGKRRLAIDHLPVLAAALGVTVDALLGPVVTPDPRVRRDPQRHDGLTLWPLTRRGPAAGVHAYRCRIEPSRSTPPDTLPVHDGHDWMYVLEGRMRLLLGEQEMVIEQGEAVEFDTLTPHWFGAVDGPVEVLAIFSPQGQRLHLRT